MIVYWSINLRNLNPKVFTHANYVFVNRFYFLLYYREYELIYLSNDLVYITFGQVGVGLDVNLNFSRREISMIVLLTPLSELDRCGWDYCCAVSFFLKYLWFSWGCGFYGVRHWPFKLIYRFNNHRLQSRSCKVLCLLESIWIHRPSIFLNHIEFIEFSLDFIQMIGVCVVFNRNTF